MVTFFMSQCVYSIFNRKMLFLKYIIIIFIINKNYQTSNRNPLIKKLDKPLMIGYNYIDNQYHLFNRFINNMNKTIKIDDFYLASYLMTYDVSLVGHRRSENRSTFEFNGDDLDELIDAYYDGDTMVSPMRYAKAIRSLKNVMYNSNNYNIKSTYNNDSISDRKDSK